MHSARDLDINKYYAANECTVTKTLCNEEAVWFEQNLLLSEKKDMDGIAAAIDKIRANADALKKNSTK